MNILISKLSQLGHTDFLFLPKKEDDSDKLTEMVNEKYFSASF